jgi:hypothetical protein
VPRRFRVVVQVGRLLTPGVLQGADAMWPLKAAVGVDHTGEVAVVALKPAVGMGRTGAVVGSLAGPATVEWRFRVMQRKTFLRCPPSQLLDGQAIGEELGGWGKAMWMHMLGRLPEAECGDPYA